MNKRYVNTAKNQGNCGSCYVFAAVGALEGQIKRYFNQLPVLSTQQIVSCGGRGCDGGNAVSLLFKFSKFGLFFEQPY